MPIFSNWGQYILSSPHFVLYLVSRYFLFVLRVPPFTQSPVKRMQVTFHWRHRLFTSPTFQVSFCHFIINNNKSQLLLQPYIPSHLINLKNQLRYRLLNMWKLFCVRLLSSFLDTNDNKVALPVVHRKKLWKARLKIMRILLFFDNTS